MSMMQEPQIVVSRHTWVRMAAKAEREGLRAFRINGSNRNWAVTSHTDAGIAYEVTILDGDILCSCRGSEFFPYCKHRALVLRELGLLADPDDAEPVVIIDHLDAALRAA